jgi:ribosomal protein S18 acetylase RimI-like enzyme
MDPSGSRVAVRDARADDISAIERIEETSFDGDRLSRRSLMHHLTSSTCELLIATLKGEPAGYALVFYRSGSDIARLYSIASAPEARGAGIGSKLLSACERRARGCGRGRMRLEVRADNTPAISLYRSRGYRDFGRYEAYYEDGGPALRMEKRLSARGGKATA